MHAVSHVRLELKMVSLSRYAARAPPGSLSEQNKLTSSSKQWLWIARNIKQQLQWPHPQVLIVLGQHMLPWRNIRTLWSKIAWRWWFIGESRLSSRSLIFFFLLFLPGPRTSPESCLMWDTSNVCLIWNVHANMLHWNALFFIARWRGGNCSGNVIQIVWGWFYRRAGWHIMVFPPVIFLCTEKKGKSTVRTVHLLQKGEHSVSGLDQLWGDSTLCCSAENHTARGIGGT